MKAAGPALRSPGTLMVDSCEKVREKERESEREREIGAGAKMSRYAALFPHACYGHGKLWHPVYAIIAIACPEAFQTLYQ